jgi:hypothetical protein
MSDINKLGLDKQLRRETTRRTAVTTGAKLAYAAPLVAASLRLTADGALAACGGTTPLELTVDDRLLCCGCCPQSGSTSARAMKRLKALQATDPAFAACQTLLASQNPPIPCPQAGQPGSDVERVCIAENVNPISPPT